MIPNNDIRSQDFHSLIKEICKGDKTSLEKLQGDPNYHWSSVIIPRTKESLLHLAAQYGHPELIHYMLSEFHPKVVDIRNIDNKTPLHVACQFGNLDCVRILIENGADVNAIKRADWTPLMLACTNSGPLSREIVEYLIDNGAILNFKNKDGWTCLHLASRNENPSILEVIYNCEKKIDFKSLTKNGRTALHISALHGNLENVKLLISKIDIECEDSSGNTPIHEAVLGGKIELIDFLISKGANVFAKNKTSSNVLHLAAANGSNDVIKHFVNKYGFDLNKITLNGHTSLHCAARKGHSASFNLLVELGADMSIQDQSGRLASEYLQKL